MRHAAAVLAVLLLAAAAQAADTAPVPLKPGARSQVALVRQEAGELRLRVGHAISVVGHDDLPTSELLDPPLATIRLDRREMGRAAMRRLLEQVPPGDYVAPVELAERASLQAPG